MSQIKPSRYASRSSNDKRDILEVLHQTLFCTVSYVHNDEPYSLPTGFCVQDEYLIIHGSIKSHFLDAILQAKKVCISTFIFDGLVLATSAFEHSVNYRSAVVFSEAQEEKEENKKLSALRAFTEKYIPGRWEHLRPITKGEVEGTRVLVFSIAQASIKQRTGPPGFKKDDWFDKVWTGEIPAKIKYLSPIQNPEQKNLSVIPRHIDNLIATTQP